jgi:hypothetical protein
LTAPLANRIATLTSTLGPYDDYQINFSIRQKSAIVVDGIQVVDVATGRVIAQKTVMPPLSSNPCKL